MKVENVKIECEVREQAHEGSALRKAATGTPTTRKKNDCKPATRRGYRHHGTGIEEVPIEPEEEKVQATARTPS